MNTMRIGKRLGTTTDRLAPIGKWLWVVPILGVLLLGGGYWLRTSIAGVMKDRLGQQLETTLAANVAGLEILLDSQRSLAGALARSPRIAGLIEKAIADLAGSDDLGAAARKSASIRQLQEVLGPFCEAEGFPGYWITDAQGHAVVTDDDTLLGGRDLAESSDFLDQALGQGPLVTPPFAIPHSQTRHRNWIDPMDPVMFAAAPVRNAAGDPIAVLSLEIDPEKDFSRMLRVARPGESGESYAFDRDGRLLSLSRFEDHLRSIGLLPADPEIHSTLNVTVRDPGGNLLQGYQPTQPPDDRPLTRMVQAAIAGEDGVDVDGYRDYRGVPVIGAWRWLPDYGIGVAFEVDVAEAFAPLQKLRNLVWGLFALLAGSTLVILLSTVLVSSASQRMSAAVEEARKIGQYTLKEKLGEGGMGEVYLAHHAMLTRPAALKLLRRDRASEKDIVRFEREVQQTSKLTHPNTVRIFDYGQNSDGIFYYAMEYLPGVTLERLIRISGPQCPARVIHILREVTDSLREAHDIGLIHRDIKPANIMLCERGGIYDVPKVVDFGIVKNVDSEDVKLTAVDVMSGTPQYLSPEGIKTPGDIDARADLYSLGAVGYFLLTGEPVFEGATVMEVCAQHLKEVPVPPSQRLGKPIPPALERLILQCLAKNRDKRPRNAQRMYEALALCEDFGRWTRSRPGNGGTPTSSRSRIRRRSSSRSRGTPPSPRPPTSTCRACPTRPVPG